jgi:hypothetical protein
MAAEHFINAFVSRGTDGFFNPCTSGEQRFDNRHKVYAWSAVHDGPRRLTQNCAAVDVLRLKRSATIQQ